MVTVQGNFAQFRFYRPQALDVQVLGDFNGWRAGVLRMRPAGDGYWVAGVHLAGGSYKFRYLADGQWFTDYAAFGVEYGQFGVDSIVRVAGGHQREAQAGKPRDAAVGWAWTAGVKARKAASSLSRAGVGGLGARHGCVA